MIPLCLKEKLTEDGWFRKDGFLGVTTGRKHTSGCIRQYVVAHCWVVYYTINTVKSCSCKYYALFFIINIFYTSYISFFLRDHTVFAGPHYYRSTEFHYANPAVPNISPRLLFNIRQAIFDLIAILWCYTIQKRIW